MKSKLKNENSIKFKELEWKIKDNDKNRLFAKPSELLWAYYIKTLSNKHYELDLYEPKEDPCKYTSRFFPTMDEAKQAATKHYNQVLKNLNHTKEKP